MAYLKLNVKLRYPSRKTFRLSNWYEVHYILKAESDSKKLNRLSFIYSIITRSLSFTFSLSLTLEVTHPRTFTSKFFVISSYSAASFSRTSVAAPLISIKAYSLTLQKSIERKKMKLIMLTSILSAISASNTICSYNSNMCKFCSRLSQRSHAGQNENVRLKLACIGLLSNGCCRRNQVLSNIFYWTFFLLLLFYFLPMNTVH